VRPSCQYPVSESVHHLGDMLALIQTVLLSQMRCNRRCEKKSKTTKAEEGVRAIGDATVASALQATDVFTRNELLAMMPKEKRRARETEVACLPAVVPSSSLARDASSAFAQARRTGHDAATRPPLEVTAASPTSPRTPQAVASASGKHGGLPLGLDAEAISDSDEDGDFQLRVLAAAERLAGLGEKAGPEVTLLMQELEELAERIAKADEMRKQAAASPPAKDGEAAKWHDVALVTLNWSQQELLKRQKAALLRLVEIAEQPESKAGVAAQSSATGQLVPFIQQEPAAEEKSMKKDLEALRLHNPDCVLIVRKIKKLGWESPALLRKYFEQYGKVREIFVTHSTMKPNPKRPGGRARPAALGFIVMADQQGKAAVLSCGKEQFVLGVAIDVAAFNPFLDTNWDEATE